MNVYNTNNRSNDKSLFKKQNTTNNPFYTNIAEGNKNTLVTLMQQSDRELLKKNSLFAAALKGDPYAVWGITSQIRIA